MNDSSAAVPTSRPRWIQRIGIGLALVVGLVLVLGIVNRRKLHRLWFMASLFSEGDHVDQFRSMDTVFPTRTVRRAGPVFTWDVAPRPLPETFTVGAESYNVADFLDHTETTGLLVIKDDRIAFEQYYRGNTAATRTISMSVAKSFVSALIGIAIAEGRIADIMDPVTQYAPELAGSGYDGVPLKHVLQMSSGVRWNEEYGDFNSDINRWARAFALGASLDAFAATLPREREPGTFNQYVSMNTHVLAMVLARATGRTLSAYMEEKLWQPLGMESDAYWMLDDTGMEVAFGGLNATLRDYAKLGRLYLRGGDWNGTRIVPAEWVRTSVTPDAPHLQPGDNPLSDYFLGYGYQWWIPEDPDGDFLAIGVYNQFIYVYPKERLVIAKTSANRRYVVEEEESERASIALFRAIAAQLHDDA